MKKYLLKYLKDMGCKSLKEFREKYPEKTKEYFILYNYFYGENKRFIFITQNERLGEEGIIYSENILYKAKKEVNIKKIKELKKYFKKSNLYLVELLKKF